jgi:hypothetical protein
MIILLFHEQSAGLCYTGRVPHFCAVGAATAEIGGSPVAACGGQGSRVEIIVWDSQQA